MNIPEGWKLVPVEPTVEMVIVLEDAYCDQLDARIGDPNRKEWPSEDSQPLAGRLAYRAALAAAPTPPPQKDEPVYQSSWDGVYWADISKKEYESRQGVIHTRTLYTRPDTSDLQKVAELVAHTERKHALIKITKRSTTYLALGTPLYTHPDNSDLRKAAEEAIGIINDAIERLDDVPCRIVMRLHDAVENLCAALEAT